MSDFIKVYLVAVVAFFAIDMVWLGLVAKDFYREQIGYIMKSNFNWIAALAFYFLYIVGLVFFAVNPALEKGDWTYALLAGGLFGLISYATYDLTNLATLEGWPLKITIIDMIWGTVLGGSVSTATFFVADKFIK